MAEELGTFAAGEVPPVLQVTFVDNTTDQNPINLTGFDPHIEIEAFPDVDDALGQGTINITDATNGIVQYQWHEDDMQGVADYTVLVWVDDGGTQRYASDELKYTVFDGPGPTPAW